MAENVKQPKASKAAKLPSTQRFLAISEVRDGTVVLRDGTLRSVLLCSSVNFSLKSEEEQEALIAGYVQFLNTLDFPLQIVVQSRKLSIDPYLSRLAESEKNQTNELLRLQIADYRKFVAELVELGAIMSKRFFMIVPYDPVSDKKRGFWSRIQDVVAPARAVRLREEKFGERRKELLQRTEHVIGNMGSLGITAVPLDTQSLIELFYNLYNPEVSAVQKLPPVDQIQVE